MTISIADLAYTNNVVTNKRPFPTDLDTAFLSVQTYVNSLKNSTVQLAKDSFPSAYALNGTGVATQVHSLYDKLYNANSYTGGDYTISTTGAWTDLDASNAIVTITPEIAGNFKTNFMFSVSCVSSNATNAADVRFRVTDGTTNSIFNPRIHLITGVTATTNVSPIALSFVFDSWSASLKTVKLQYFITTLTAMTIKVLANSNDPISMIAEKI